MPELVGTPAQPCTQEVLAAEQAASRSLRAGALADCRSAFRLGRASITEGCAFVTRSSDRCEQQIWTRGEVREEGADGPQVLRCALRDGRTTQVRLAERLLKHRLHDFAVSVLTHQPSCRSAHTAAVYLDRLVALSQRRRLRLCSGVEGWRYGAEEDLRARRWAAAATDYKMSKMSKSGWTPLVSLNCRLVQGE